MELSYKYLNVFYQRKYLCSKIYLFFYKSMYFNFMYSVTNKDLL